MRTVGAVLGAWLALSVTAYAADAEELWPEISLYKIINPKTRILVDSAFAKGKESDISSPDLGVYLDLSFKAPVALIHPGMVVLKGDWQRSSTIWARFGFDRIFAAPTGSQKGTTAEDRGVVALSARTELRGQVWLESRARADLRWIGGAYSTRYRLKLEATREFSVCKHTVIPYLNGEVFYDTRYDGWARTIYMAGSEITQSDHFRYEIFLARQTDRLPQATSLLAAGLVAKWYY